MPSSCCSPAARASATAFSGLNPPGAQLQDGSCSFAERVFCRASAICPRRASRPTKTLLRYDPGLPANTMKVPCPANRRTRSALLQQQLQYGLHGGGNSPIFSETVENSGAAVFRPSFWRTASRAHAPQSPPNSYLLQNVKLRRSYVFRKGAYGMDETENGVVGFTTGRSASRERLNMVWRLGGAAPTAGVWVNASV